MDAFNFDEAKRQKTAEFEKAFASVDPRHHMQFTVEERAIARKFIAKHPAWRAYAAKWAIDSGALDKRRIAHFAAENGLSRDVMLATTATASTPDTRAQIEETFSLTEEEAAVAANARRKAEADAYADMIGGKAFDLHSQGITAEQTAATLERTYNNLTTQERADMAQVIKALRRIEAMEGTAEAARKQEEAPKPEPVENADHAAVIEHTPKQAKRKAAMEAAANAAYADAQKANEAFRPMAEAMKPFIMPFLMAEVRAQTEQLVGELPTTTITVARPDGTTHRIAGAAHPQFATLLRVLSQPMASGYYPNVLLVGGTGTGKTHAAHQAAEALGIPYYHMGSLSGAHELIGFIDAHGTYHETPFVKAFRDGGLVLLDEVDSGDANATLAVNAALANGACEFPQIGLIQRHKNCRIVAAANTWNGPTAEFIGRNKLDGAFLSRFPVKLAWNADVAFELRIGGNEQFTKRVQDARTRAGVHGLKHNIDIRHAMAGSALIAAGFTHDEAAKMTYQAGLKPEQVKMVEGQ